jgi:hypothetical protein
VPVRLTTHGTCPLLAPAHFWSTASSPSTPNTATLARSWPSVVAFAARSCVLTMDPKADSFVPGGGPSKGGEKRAQAQPSTATAPPTGDQASSPSDSQSVISDHYSKARPHLVGSRGPVYTQEAHRDSFKRFDQVTRGGFVEAYPDSLATVRNMNPDVYQLHPGVSAFAPSLILRTRLLTSLRHASSTPRQTSLAISTTPSRAAAGASLRKRVNA